jgi:hypothetical protein
VLTSLALGAAVAASPATAASTATTTRATGHAAALTGLGTVLADASESVGAATSSWARARKAAEAALHRAQDALAGQAGHAGTPTSRGATTPRTDLTLTLRNLRQGLAYLAPRDRAVARDVLARPTQGSDDPNGDGYRSSATKHRECGTHVCVWWVTNADLKDKDPVPSADSDGDQVPDQVELTLSVMEGVWDRIVTQGGYRAPLGDRDRGGDDRLDIFLADIGDEGLFGYCAPELSGSGRSASGYCVLDNDYSTKQFGTSQTAEHNLQVTAAHEFFHAVQFAYDVGEDDWFMEGTAMWMEDEIYDDVNDNVRYLQGSQLTNPTRALDQPAAGMGGPYVSWIWWRYLTETFPDRGTSGLPLIMRDVWRRAQAYTPNYPRAYSMQALRLAVAAQGNSLANVFARFGEANRHPEDSYEEGKEQDYPTAPSVAGWTLSKSNRTTGEKVATMAHMTNYTVVLTPGKDLAGGDWVVRIPVNAPDYARGSRAQVAVIAQDGTRTRRWVALDKRGNGVVTAQFRKGQVKQVELTLTNAGQRYVCHRGTYLACQGTSRDNGLKTYFRATINQR